MTSLLTKLFHPDGDIVRWWVSLGRAWPVWAVLIALAAIALGCWWAYRPTASGALERPRAGGPAGRGLPAGKRWTMAVLRVVAILLLLAVVLEPLLGFDQTLGVKPALIVLLDDTQSMTIRDRRLTDADKLAAAKAAGKVKYAKKSGGGDIEDLTRAELLAAVWKNSELDLTARLGKKFDVRFMRFSRDAQPAAAKSADAAVKELAFAGGETDVGRAIRRGLTELRGRPAAGVLVFTDGASNRGEPPAEAARAAADAKVPVFPVGLGLREAKDLQIASFLADDVIFIGETARVNGKLAQRGYRDDSVTVELRRENEIVARKVIPLSGGAEESFELQFTPKVKGEATYRLAVENRPDELIATNNARDKRIKVIDEKIKVLLAAEAPQWDARFVKGSLIRDNRVLFRTWVREADSQQLAAAGLPEYVATFPAKREDLFKYDVIILADIPATAFSKEQLKLLEEFVATNGGGLMFAAGPRFNPSTFAKTALEPLVPVVFAVQPDSTPETELFNPLVQPMHIELTREGLISPVCALSDTDAGNTAIWRKMPPFYWHFPALRLRPAATALAVVAESPVKDGRKTPLMAYQYYGRGVTFYLGIDSTWRWRDRVGNRYLARFWGQTINFLSMAHMLGESKRVQIALDARTYSIGDTVAVTARVLDKGYQPLKASEIVARVARGETEPADLTLRELPNQPGMFAGEYLAAALGDYTVAVRGEEAEGRAAFQVQMPQLEFDRPTMDEDALRTIAATSGGRFFEIADLDTLPEAIANARPVITTPGSRTIWDCWPMLVLIVLVLSIELFIRKRSDLA